MKRPVPALAAAVGIVVLTLGGSPAAGTGGEGGKPECAENAVICTEVNRSIGYAGAYTGHDEPSLLFYSNAAGSGNSMTYRITLPTEPPTPPRQDGTGG